MLLFHSNQLVCVILALFACQSSEAGGYGKRYAHLRKPVPLERQSFNPKPLENLIDADQLPKNFDWSKIEASNGGVTNLLQPSWNQHIPQASSNEFRT